MAVLKTQKIRIVSNDRETARRRKTDPENQARRRRRATAASRAACAGALFADPAGLLEWLQRNAEPFRTGFDDTFVAAALEHVRSHRCKPRERLCCAVEAFLWLTAGAQEMKRVPYLVEVVRASRRHASAVSRASERFEKDLRDRVEKLPGTFSGSAIHRRHASLLATLRTEVVTHQRKLNAIVRRLESTATAPSSGSRRKNYRPHLAGAESALRRGEFKKHEIMKMIIDLKGNPEQRGQRLRRRLRRARPRLVVVTR